MILGSCTTVSLQRAHANYGRLFFSLSLSLSVSLLHNSKLKPDINLQQYCTYIALSYAVCWSDVDCLKKVLMILCFFKRHSWYSFISISLNLWILASAFRGPHPFFPFIKFNICWWWWWCMKEKEESGKTQMKIQGFHLPGLMVM